MEDYNAAFKWEQQPDAEKLALKILSLCLEEHSWLRELNYQLHEQTSTRLFDWIDHLTVSESHELHHSLESCGYVEEGRFTNCVSYRHPGAQLPTIVVSDHPEQYIGVAVSVESISDFLMVRGLHREIHGSIYSPYRRCLVEKENNISFWVVERRGTRTMECSYPASEYLNDYMASLELWTCRPRQSLDEKEELHSTLGIAHDLVAVMGRDLAAWIVLEGERKYWQSRNSAGHIQKGRQDRLGMGWANHDHYTFRSTRRNFCQLVELFKILGFSCRERFYAGEEAGWGAQVMENGNAGLTLFLDVDLTPEEISIDFAHQSLPEIHELGTVGLWCELHGDSILKAGMHHLELQFNFDDLRDDLQKLGVGMMDPFSDFSYLRQAFTKGETWTVDPMSIQRLLSQKLITEEQAKLFSEHGAIGSHMENLQRREGYKGFNQKNVSNIIKRTDPRQVQV